MTRASSAIAVVSMLWLVACSQPAPPATLAQASLERILYEDGHIRLIEVTNQPGASAIAAIPYFSVVFGDGALPEVAAHSGATSGAPEMVSDIVLPPDGRPAPWCRVEGPRAASTISVEGDAAQHYYRIDYKRVDGKDYVANWQSWYPDVFARPQKPVANLGKALAGKDPHSKEWPYNIAYSAVNAAPANHTVRYKDDSIEMVEVAIRPGETENMHGHPYSSIYADDGGFSPAGAVYSNISMVKGFTVPWGKLTSPFEAGTFPICFAAIPEPPHQVTVKSGPPQHFYRVHFLNVDGSGAASVLPN